MVADGPGGVEPVVVETNWILDVALHRNQGSEELCEYAERGYIQLFLPSFCIAESVKVFEGIQRTWKGLGAQSGRVRDELLRSAFIDAANSLDLAQVLLAAATDIAEADLWAGLERVTPLVTLLPPTVDTVRATADMRQFLDLTPADASVAANVVDACRKGICRRFMSRDRVFAEEPVRTYLVAEGVEVETSPLPIIGPIRQRLQEGRGF
jgi:hypothetical protein